MSLSTAAAIQLMKMRFPLCFVQAVQLPWLRAVELSVKDSGGLVAVEIVREPMTGDAAARFIEALDKLSDVFETPSHWMAL
jgi:hypothetical protein